VSLGIPNVRLLKGEELAKELPESLGAKLAIAMDGQAQFNAYSFCTELAKKINGDGCDVFEHARVLTVEDHPLSQGKPHDVELESGGSLTADQVRGGFRRGGGVGAL